MSTERDPARIPEIVELLRGVWEQHPDWRLGQLISNACRHVDPFYVEDELIVDRLWLLMAPEQ